MHCAKNRIQVIISEDKRKLSGTFGNKLIKGIIIIREEKIMNINILDEFQEDHTHIKEISFNNSSIALNSIILDKI